MNDNNIFLNAFDAIDDELIAEAKSPTIYIATRRKKIIISSIAACVAAVLVAIPSIKVISDLNDNKFTESNDTEIITEIISGESSTEQAQSEPTKNEQHKNEPQDTNSNPDNSDKSSGINSAPGSSGPISAGTDSDKITIFYNPVGVTDIYRDPSATTYDKLSINDMPFASEDDSTIVVPDGTKSYDKIYVPDIKYLYINPIPIDKYITFYSTKITYNNPPSEKEARLYLDAFLPRLSSALQASTPKYTLKYDYSTYFNEEKYSAYIRINDPNDSSLFFRHNKYDTEINLGQNNVTKKEQLMIDGKAITVDHTKTDQEIIESLSWVKQRLFSIFGVVFDDAKIIRDYGETYGDVYVYFYKSNGITRETAEYEPFTNYIKIKFSGNMVESDILKGFDVDCEISRATNVARVEGDTFKLIPLEKAEEYLYKNYVFGGPICPLCEANQAPVDFEEYDYVGINYSYSFPCYAFYKNIGTAENGNMIFAKTYVPAVEVEGYEEYFENKHANH